ncbi:MutS-related protein [Hymenobacter sp. CRA2]|uniref:MutS-related protein n=1 Tax=Hymenobacter sp. CRA2 TaxID=1955620 RepID=UPI0009902893|nr:hypothetical protein [Hymenobacter sp. CRA2]OON66716.1 hypothetical protein B0919_21260 [Hymenobacter sp. CRA2]
MLVIDDLRLEEDILPLFNHTNSADGEAALRTLLLQLPASLGQVQERQAVVCGLLAHWPRLADFFYSRIQQLDVWQLLHDISTRRLALDRSRWVAWLRLLVSEEARYAQRGKCVQLILLLRRLRQRLLEPLVGAELPASFMAQLTVIRRLGIERLALAVDEDRFSLAQLVELGRQLQRLTPEDVAAFWQAFGQFEAYWSVAYTVVQRGFVLADFAPGTFQLTDFYHPLLRQPVKNSLQLHPPENVVLLTGPNMSGKSTLLKAISLCVYLAHAGVGVPAVGCVVPFFQTISVAINLNDSLQSGYSHFMAEIQNLKTVLTCARPGHPTFAVFDEIFRGTNVDDALDITQATIAGLARYPNSYFFISTHLLQLQAQLPAHAVNICQLCIHCVLEDGIPRFTYQLRPGWTTLRIGRILFEQAGLPSLLAPPLA